MPLNYPSGDPLGTSTSTWNNTTIAGLNLAPGTYVWTFGSEPNVDSFTLVIEGSTSVPTLSEWAIILLNLLLALGVFAGMNRKEMK